MVDAENYLLSCYRYIELNPVVASMVEMLGKYPWSSYNANAWGKAGTLIALHEIYLRIHTEKLMLEKDYRKLFHANLQVHDVRAIRESLSANQVFGGQGII